VIWFYLDDDVRHTNKTYTIDTADTWEKKTITIDGDTTGVIDNDNGGGLQFRFILVGSSTYTGGTAPDGTWEAYTASNAFEGQTVNLADSTSNYINITGVQLEIGEGASDFEHLPYDVQLQRCQRYYYRFYNQPEGNHIPIMMMAWGSGQAEGPILFPVEMRTEPSYTQGSGTNYYAVQLNSFNLNVNSWNWWTQSNKKGGLVYQNGLSGLSNGTSYRIVGQNSGAFMAFDAEL